MLDNTISGSITGTLTLGVGPYLSALTITSAGIVDGGGSGRNAVVAGVQGVTLDNSGHIYGGDAAEAVLTNYFIGPADRRIYTYKNIDYSASGDGVSLTAAWFTNTGAIFGGTGASGGDYGAGVYLVASTSTNSGLIQGGSAWGKLLDLTLSTNGDAAPGAVLVGGYFQNVGTFIGGEGLAGIGPNPNNNIGSHGGQGGDGATISGGSVLENGGIVQGGQGGAGGNGGFFFASTPSTDFYSGGTGGSGGTGAYIEGGTIVNSGLISGGIGGVGGAGSGQPQGVAGQTGIGVVIQTGLLVNSGTISGDTAAVRFAGTGTLQLGTGAVFGGIVQADAAAEDVLALAGDVGGTIQIGAEFRNFSTLDLSQGTSWTIEGSLTELETLTITGLSSSDAIEILGVTAATPHYVSGIGLEVDTSSGTAILPVVGGLNGAQFDVAPCFCVGTRIRTPRGEVEVECLRIGDEVVTAHAGVHRIKWIGHRSYDGRFIEGNHLALPVGIKKDAIADGIPSRDLWVSPDHAIAEAGVLIHAWRLVNGKTIVQAQQVQHVSYVHIELGAHQIIFAEDCATETFRDMNCRSRFQNAAQYMPASDILKPQPPCLPLVEGGFHLYNIRARLAARAGIRVSPRAPGPLRGNLDEMGPRWLRGWAQDIKSPEEPVLLDILIDGNTAGKLIANHYRMDLRVAGLGSGCHAFEAPLPTFATSLQVRRSSDGAYLGGRWLDVA